MGRATTKMMTMMLTIPIVTAHVTSSVDLTDIAHHTAVGTYLHHPNGTVSKSGTLTYLDMYLHIMYVCTLVGK